MYLLFREIELKMSKHLFLTLQEISSVDSRKRQHIISAIASDDNVQFHWTLLSVDIESEEQAVELLEQIVGLWLTIQGFSLTGAWMEQY